MNISAERCTPIKLDPNDDLDIAQLRAWRKISHSKIWAEIESIQAERAERVVWQLQHLGRPVRWSHQALLGSYEQTINSLHKSATDPQNHQGVIKTWLALYGEMSRMFGMYQYAVFDAWQKRTNPNIHIPARRKP